MALGLGTQIRTLAAVGAECGSTAFLGWCQSACGWYLRQTPNAAARERYLSHVLRAQALAGTGMSNTVKHLSGIEKHLLQAVPGGDGFVINGSLPWVSNLGDTACVCRQCPAAGWPLHHVHGAWRCTWRDAQALPGVLCPGRHAHAERAFCRCAHRAG